MTKFIFIILFLIPLAWSTRVNANYFTTKSFLLYFVGGLSFLGFFFHKNPAVNRPSGIWQWMIGFFIGLQVFYALAFDITIGLLLLPKFLCLIGIIFYFMYSKFDLVDFLKKYEWFVLGFFGILFILTSKSFVHQIGKDFSFQSLDIIYPFGNANMLAEFYLLCLPLVYFWIQQRNEILPSIKGIIMVLLHVILFATKSRSALLGVGLWWGLLLFHHIKPYFKVLLSLGIGLLLTCGVFLYKTNEALFVSKARSASERMVFYKSAWDLIQERPFGVGFQYANQIVPYRLKYSIGPSEAEYPDQPHSEVLKWGVEFGWLGLVMSLICLFLMAQNIFTQGNLLLKGAALVILPQILFQFPFENPATIVLLALYLYLFSRSIPQTPLVWTKLSKGLSFIVGVGLIYYSVIFIGSVYLESNYPNSLEKTTQACDLNPSYMRGCIRKNFNLLQTHQFFKSKQSLKADMRLNYYASDYLKILSNLISDANVEPDLVMQNDSATSISVFENIENQSSRNKENCQIIHIYAFIYKYQQHYSEDDLKACRDTPPPFEFRTTPAEFDRQYRSWLDTLLK